MDINQLLVEQGLPASKCLSPYLYRSVIDGNKDKKDKGQA
jgi:hypothetical protein